MKRIAVASAKGGVGKTSCAVGLASVFASRGLRVLFVDVDSQANGSWALGAELRPTGGAADLIIGRPVAPQVVGDISIFAGSPALLSADVSRVDPEALADALDNVEGFDVAIIDSPPGHPTLERLAIVAADIVFGVCDAHPFGLSGVSRIVRDIEERQRKRRRGPSAVALVASRVDSRRAADRELADALRGIGSPVFVIPQDAALSGATADRVRLMDAAPTSRAAEALGLIADWSLKK